MSASEAGRTTRILKDVRRGDSSAAEKLFPLVYDELRSLARRELRNERAGHTLQPTALVHEAYLRLVDQNGVEWQDRAHFLGFAARVMRQVLVDHARRRHAQKREGGIRVTLSDAVKSSDETDGHDLLDLDDALGRLRELDERKSRIIELRYFGGLGDKETAEVLEVSVTTVERDWRMARAWLLRELSRE